MRRRMFSGGECFALGPVPVAFAVGSRLALNLLPSLTRSQALPRHILAQHSVSGGLAKNHGHW